MHLFVNCCTVLIAWLSSPWLCKLIPRALNYPTCMKTEIKKKTHFHVELSHTAKRENAHHNYNNRSTYTSTASAECYFYFRQPTKTGTKHTKQTLTPLDLHRRIQEECSWNDNFRSLKV